MLIATDYRGIQLVRCSGCGEIYPVCEHSCPECGSNIIIFVRKGDKDDNIRSGKNTKSSY